LVVLNFFSGAKNSFFATSEIAKNVSFCTFEIAPFFPILERWFRSAI
jgi:hypothetical protein